MTTSPAFVALEGMTAIEASAGTGKTYTITQLYLRLVLEHGLDVASILVVTYTKAATAELRRKIRDRLVEAAAMLASEVAPDPDRFPFYAELLPRLPDRAAAWRAIDRALQGFDEAAVFTIHGFCQRVLAERAFESGVAFDAELVPDQQELVLEVVDDFWRRTFGGAGPALARHLLEQEKWTPEKLAADLRMHLGRHYGRVVTPGDPGDLRALEAARVDAVVRVRAAWAAGRAAVIDLLGTAPLNRNSYKPAIVDRMVAAMDAFAAAPGTSSDLFGDDFARFTTTKLAGATRKGWTPPAHPLFAACDALAAADAACRGGYATRAGVLRAELLGYAERELRARKAEARVQFYDDLLGALARALEDPARGPELAESVRGRYRAALIDEFQDTDPVQYAIVRRIYGESDRPVVFVGDPKQAIYSFRGADVFSYLRARGDAGAQERLGVNYRADAPLVRAVNALFGSRPRPFLLDGIPFVPSEAADAGEPSALEVMDDEPAALRLWWMGEGDGPINKGVAQDRATQATAAEVARLLALGQAGRATLGGQPLAGGDVAVLVRTNEEGRRMREALLALGVPSVQQAVDSVFASREAAELERVLLAVAEPGQAPLVRAALVTEMLGKTAEDLEGLAADDVAWDERIETFHEYHHRWGAHGFVAMLRDLVVREKVTERLLAFPDGERRLTNLAHVTELLQATAMHQRGGMAALVEWLADARRGAALDAMAAEEHLVRLESDAGLVAIVTVHKAKGLQYPVVFCPFLWNGRLRARDGESVVCHEPGVEGATLDLGVPPDLARREQACREELAELLRLLYVAVTRAQHRCYLVWGHVKEGGTSPLAWLLHAGDATADLRAVEARYQKAGAGALLAEVRAVAARAAGAIAVEPLPAGPGVRFQPPPVDAARLAPRRLGCAVPRGYTIASYTALVAGSEDPERPDYDQAGARGEGPGPARLDVHGFPRGARAGRALHELLEATDFTAPDAAVVATTLRTWGIDDTWTPVTVEWLHRIVATPLDEARPFRLADVPRTRRVDELEFYYPVRGLDVARLAADLDRAGFASGAFAEAATRIRPATVDGFLKGYVDCVVEHDGRYFVVDYKSNWLGDGPEAYAAPALVEAMAHGQYWLQYLVYVLALHRLLARRLPGYDYDTHVGGVRYLFLRGMDPARGARSGVYADRPSRDVVGVLEAAIGGAT